MSDLSVPQGRAQGFGGLTSLPAEGPPAIPEAKLAIEQWTTPQGTRVLFVAASHLPMLDLKLRFDAGSAHDGPHPGLAAVTLEMIDQGSMRFTGKQIAEKLEALGCELSRASRAEHSTLSLRCLSSVDLRKQAIDLLSDIVGRPLLANEQLQEARRKWRDTLSQRQQHPVFALRQALFDQLYGLHPYATHYLGGSLREIDAISSQQVVDFYHRAYSAQNLSITLVGDLTRAEAERLALEISHVLPNADFTHGLHSPAENVAQSVHIERPGTNCWAGLALPVEAEDADRPALTAAMHILVGGGAVAPAPSTTGQARDQLQRAGRYHPQPLRRNVHGAVGRCPRTGPGLPGIGRAGHRRVHRVGAIGVGAEPGAGRDRQPVAPAIGEQCRTGP